MAVVQTTAKVSKIKAQEAWELLGPAGLVRVTIVPITAGTQIQLDGNNGTSTNAPLANRRRVRVYSITAPASPPAIQANVGFDTGVSATAGIPVTNWPSGFYEALADSGVAIWAWPLVTGTLALYEEATG